MGNESHLSRPFTTQCAKCKLWASCDYYETLEAIEDEVVRREGQEVGFAFLRACFTFNCYDYVSEGESK